MGKYDMCMKEFLQNKKRFADLFNGCWFQGKPVILAEDLLDASETYSANRIPCENTPNVNFNHAQNNLHKKQSSRSASLFRDVKMRLCSGTLLQILAIENQSYIDYSMPVRCMEYDTAEYRRQLKERKQELHLLNTARNQSYIPNGQFLPVTDDEKLSGILKTDRLQPVYTLCLYTGTDPWDGPRMLSDMMAFDPKDRQLQFLFKDYPLNLFCINEHDDFSKFHTDLKELFQVIRCRKDKEKLAELMQDQTYSHLSEDTWDTIAVMTDNVAMLQKKNLYKTENREKEEFNMCQALEELINDGVLKGKQEGKSEGALDKTKSFIHNLLLDGFSIENICRLAECDPALVDEVKTELIEKF